MRTEKEITSISYNSIEFLESQCQSLLRAGKIDFYAFIKHKGELDPFDGTRDKDHIHILVRPLSAIDTAQFVRVFEEIDMEDPKKPPLGCVRFEKCNSPGDWVLYSMHYAPYLDSKGEVKEFLNYPFDDYHTNNEQELKRYRRSVKFDYKATYNTVSTMLEQGMSQSIILEKINATATQFKSVNDMIMSIASKDYSQYIIVNRNDENRIVVDRFDQRYKVIDNQTGEVWSKNLADKIKP